MAKGIYVGGSVPKFTTTTATVNIDTSNIESYFTVTNGSYYFVGSGSTFTTNNGGIGGSTAQTTLTALQDISNITFTYSYSSEQNYDKFTLTVAGTTVENAVSGVTTTKTYSGSLSAGSTIIFKYTKDSSVNSYDDKCTFSDMTITTQVQVPDGTIDNVARKVIQPYVGVDNVARKVAHGYIGVDNVARRIFGDGVPMVTWKKYKCTYTSKTFTENPSSSRIGETGNSYRTFPISSSAYGFDTAYKWGGSSSGYRSNGSRYLYPKSTTTQAEFEEVVLGTYILDTFSTYQPVRRIDSINSFSNNGTTIGYDLTYTTVAVADITPASTTVGDYVTTIRVPEGDLPEGDYSGLKTGGPGAASCVILVSGYYYYYEKVNE